MTLSKTTIQTLVLNAGTATAEVMVLDAPLSFWGGFNPLNGEILDRHHPQSGQHTTQKVLVIPLSRGSAGTPAGIAEAIRRHSGPSAFILGQPDVNITVGAMVADKLYGTSTPVLVADSASYAALETDMQVQISSDGIVEFDQS